MIGLGKKNKQSKAVDTTDLENQIEVKQSGELNNKSQQDDLRSMSLFSEVPEQQKPSLSLDSIRLANDGEQEDLQYSNNDNTSKITEELLSSKEESNLDSLFAISEQTEESSESITEQDQENVVIETDKNDIPSDFIDDDFFENVDAEFQIAESSTDNVTEQKEPDNAVEQKEPDSPDIEEPTDDEDVIKDEEIIKATETIATTYESASTRFYSEPHKQPNSQPLDNIDSISIVSEKGQALSNEAIEHNNQLLGDNDADILESKAIDSLLELLEDITPEEVELLPADLKRLFYSYFEVNYLVRAKKKMQGAGVKIEAAKEFSEQPSKWKRREFSKPIDNEAVNQLIKNLTRNRVGEEAKVIIPNTNQQSNDIEQSVSEELNSINVLYQSKDIIEVESNSNGDILLYPYQISGNGILRKWDNNFEIEFHKGDHLIVNTGVAFFWDSKHEIFAEVLKSTEQRFGVKGVKSVPIQKRTPIKLELIAEKDGFISIGTAICRCYIN